MDDFTSIIGTTGTPGASGPRTFYVPAALTNGQWVTVQVADDGDTRDVANHMTPIEGAKICLDFVAARTIDWIYGGAYETLFRAAVSIGNSLVMDRGWDATTTPALEAFGPTGADAFTINIIGGSTTGRAARFEAGIDGVNAVEIYGGTTSGSGLRVQARGGDSTAAYFIGHGSGYGARFDAGATAGTPTALFHAGPVRLDTALGGTGDADPGAPGTMWGDMIIVARGRIHSAGGNSTSCTVVTGHGFNVDHASAAPATGAFPDTAHVAVVFTHQMIDANYTVIPVGHSGGYTFRVYNFDETAFFVYLDNGSTSPYATSVEFSFVVYGNLNP